MEQHIAHILGESRQSCREHSENAAFYAALTLKPIGLEQTAYISGIVHDAGKFTEEFNNYITAAANGENVQKGSVIHTFAGVYLILRLFHSHYSKTAEEGWNSLTSELIATAVGSHHALFDEYDENHVSGLEYRLAKQPKYEEIAIQNFFKECITEEKVKEIFNLAEKEIEITSMKLYELSKADSQEFMFYLGLLQRLITSAVIDGDRYDTMCFMNNSKKEELKRTAKDIPWDRMLECLEYHIEKLELKTDIQRARRKFSDLCADFAENRTDIYRLKLPTGAGKTLTGMRYALKHADRHNKKRIIYAVPLLSIVDQNARVIKESLGIYRNVVLEHHSDFDGKEDNVEDTDIRNYLVDSWNSPIIITTLVQLLNTMFSEKTSSVRRFNALCESVIIIDEVQTVPEKMLSLFNLTINFLSRICSATVILCSATQPVLEENRHGLLINGKNMISVDILNKYKKVFKRTRTEYIGELTYEQIVDIAEKRMHDCKSLLIVCNTKGEARQFYELIMSKDINCIHLSTSMCMAHRQNAIEEIECSLSSGTEFICCSTQLIEAGVDVSFGSVIRLAAGIDNVAQTAGRCNRNGEMGNNSEVSVVFLKGENLNRIPEIRMRRNITGELITEYAKNPELFDNDLLSDKSIKWYYQRYFELLNKNAGRTEFTTEDSTLFELLSSNRFYAGDNPCFSMRQAFSRAGKLFSVFEENQISVIVPYNDESRQIIGKLCSESALYDIGYEKSLLDKAKKYTVQLFESDINRLNYAKALYTNCNGILFLQEDYYDDIVGIQLDGNKVMTESSLIM